MIQTEPTPNPDSIKFLSEKIISDVGTEEFQKKEFAALNFGGPSNPSQNQ